MFRFISRDWPCYQDSAADQDRYRSVPPEDFVLQTHAPVNVVPGLLSPLLELAFPQLLSAPVVFVVAVQLGGQVFNGLIER